MGLALIAGFLCCVAVEVSWIWGRARGWDDVDAVWKNRRTRGTCDAKGRWSMK